MIGDKAIQRIGEEFPEIVEELQEQEGLLHCQISDFSRFVQKQIDNEDKVTFARICRLFLDLYNDADPDLKNALNVSFLEHLNFRDGKRRRSWAYDSMPRRMRQAVDDMDDYNRKLFGN